MMLFSTMCVSVLSATLNDGEPGAPPAHKSVQEIAKKVADTYRSTEYLSMKAIITEAVKKPSGETIPPSEKARATVAMAEGGRLRLIVIDPAKKHRVLERVCDGKVVTDGNAEQRKSVPISEAGNVHIEVDFDFCYVGNLLSSWVGPETDRANLLGQRIRDGTYKGTEPINGFPCDVVIYERMFDDNFVIRDTFYIDIKLHLLRQWTTMQAHLSNTGEIVSHVTRQRKYMNIRTGELPAGTFKASPQNESR